MSAASKFPFQSFDENLCLNCSAKFVKDDGVVQTRKLTYLEVADEGNIVKHEAISVFSALNYIFKLPLSNQIDENEELTFGCCPGCASVISRLHELHKKLDELSSMNSVISNILNMKMTVKQSEKPPAPCKAASSGNSPLVGSPNSTIQGSSACALQLCTNMNLAKNCTNCSVKLYSGPVNSSCPLEARRAVSYAILIGASHTKSRTKIPMSDVLNSILNFPQRNSMTQNINFCAECAPAILQIFKLYKNLKSRPESYLNFLFARIQSWISTGLTSSAPVGLTTRIAIMPNSRTVNAPSSVRATPVPVVPIIVSPNPIPRIRIQDQNTVAKVKVTSESQSQPFEDPICESPMDTATVSHSDSGESAGHLSDSDSDTNQTVVDAPTRIGILPGPRPIIVDAPSKNGGNERHRKPLLVPVDPVPFLRGPVGTDPRPRSRKQVFDRVIKEPEPVEPPIDELPMEVVTNTNSEPAAKPEKPRLHTSKTPRIRKYTDEQILERRRKAAVVVMTRRARAIERENRKCKKTKIIPRIDMEMKRAKSRAFARKRYKEKRSMPPITHDPCPHCGKVFVNKNRNWMKYHIAFYHKHAITKYCCDTCGRPNGSSTAKRKHARTHLNKDERLQNLQEDPPPTFLCQECGKILMSEAALKAHSRRHEGVVTRQIHCPEFGCDFNCSVKSTREKHRNRFHDPTAVPKFKCAKCSQSFRQYTELKEHEMVSCDAHNRPFACDQGSCSRRFKLKQALVLHLHDVHKLRPAEAREKVYPGLYCPAWIGRKQRKQNT